MTDRFCTGCGADRSPEDQFCTNCGSRWPDSQDGFAFDTRDALDDPPRVHRGRLGRAAVGGVISALVVGGVFVGIAMAGPQPLPPPPPPPVPTTTPAPPDPGRELSAIEAQDRATVNGLEGSWVPQVSSKRIGLHANGIVYGAQEVLEDHEAYRARYPGAVLFSSGRFATYTKPGYYVTVVAQQYPTSSGALTWCRSAGLGPDDCYAVRPVDVPDGLPTVARR